MKVHTMLIYYAFRNDSEIRVIRRCDTVLAGISVLNSGDLIWFKLVLGGTNNFAPRYVP